MSETLRPQDSAQLHELIRWAAADQVPLALNGRGSKQDLGYPVEARYQLDLSALAGITLFEPDELVLSAGAATPMAEIETLLQAHGQQMAFEPPDWGPLFGRPAGGQSLAGMLCCNLSGPRRFKAGAARDHFLGVRGISGRGEAFKSGGRVVKNVTGYDLCKLMAGSYGTLAALTAVTIKVLPAPERIRTVLLFGLELPAAIEAMAAAAASPHEVSGLAYLPAAIAGHSRVDYVREEGKSVTAIRVEGPAPSADHRCAALRQQFVDTPIQEELHSKNSVHLWQEIRDVAPLLPDPASQIWRLSVTPSAAPSITAALAEAEIAGFADWAGGLLWLALPADRTDFHRQLRKAIGHEGHATLIRGPLALRQEVPVFQPQPAALAALSRRVKHSFDPHGILNPGRMGIAAEAG